MKTGAQLIAEERERQVSKEGWTSEHDDTHRCGEMALAASAYAQHAAERAWVYSEEGIQRYQDDLPEGQWPEDWEDYWKPKDPIRDLVRAGALIAAEIDRLQRVNSK